MLGNFGGIKTIVVNAGKYVDRIGVAYEDGTHFSAGGNGGSRSRIDLANHEYVVRVDGRSGALLDQIKFTTNRGRVFGPYGGNGGAPFSVDFSKDKLALLCFYGRSGSLIDQLGFGFGSPLPDPEVFVTRSDTAGGKGGGAFDHWKESKQQLGRIMSITVRSGTLIDGLTVNYAGGYSYKCGGNGGSADTIYLKEDEWITDVFGRSGSLID